MTLIGRYRMALRPLYVVGAVDLLGRVLATRGPLAGPTCTLQLVLVAQTAPVARTFVPSLSLEVQQSPSGALQIDGRYRVGEGPVRDVPIADGTYDAELRGEHYRPQPFVLVWPPAALRTPLDAAGVPVDIGLLPGSAYPYPDATALPFGLGPTLVRGAVYAADGDPVANAIVRVIGLAALNPPNPPWPFIETRTGANGDWALVLPDRRRIGYPAETAAPGPVSMTIRVTYPPPGPTVDILNVPVTFGRENAVPNTALRGAVTRTGGRPLAGVIITTSANALRSRARSDGRWTLYLDPNQPDVANVAVTATAPDGSSATVNGVAIRNRATIVVPAIPLP